MSYLPLPQQDFCADIRAVICEETEAFREADFDRWAACWVQDERTCDVYSSHDLGFVAIRGWDAVGANMRKVFDEDLGCRMDGFCHENYQITVHGDMAWAVFDGVSSKTERLTEESFEIRVLERIDGRWRISFLSSASRRGGVRRPGRLAIAEDGQVIWMAAGTKEALEAHPAVTISAGKLRGARRHWDAALQEALHRASSLHGYFAQYKFTEETGSPFCYPIVLGEDDDGQALICTLSVQDGVTYIDIDQNAQLDRRLAAAKVIFGLSRGQMSVACRISKGMSLTAVAEDMGISINTARTHLTRIYAKTGVNSQTALVRLLHNVG